MVAMSSTMKPSMPGVAPATVQNVTASSTAASLKPFTRERDQSCHTPPYHVVLFDDDDHTFAYVVGMIRKLFGFSEEAAIVLANDVDVHGQVILETTTLERAELKRDQITSYGRDWRLDRCQGSMTAAIIPAGG